MTTDESLGIPSLRALISKMNDKFPIAVWIFVKKNDLIKIRET